MPRGGDRAKPKVEPMLTESVRCLGVGSLDKEHTFERPIGSHRRQCESCYQKSANIRGRDAHGVIDEREQR